MLNPLLAIAIVALAQPVAALGYECPPVKPSTSRQPAYGPVAGQARCEGFFEKTVSQSFVELVSLTRGPGLVGDVPPASLDLHAPARMPLQLLVQPMRSLPYYRVDAEIAPGRAVRWDPAPMLAATGLRAAEIGFLARVPRSGPAGATAVVPVALGAAAQEIPRVTATVRASVDVSSVAWRSYRLGADGSSVTAWTDVPKSQRYAFQRLEIPFDFPADDKSLRIDVQAIDAKDGRALPMLRLIVVSRQETAIAE